MTGKARHSKFPQQFPLIKCWLLQSYICGKPDELHKNCIGIENKYIFCHSLVMRETKGFSSRPFLLLSLDHWLLCWQFLFVFLVLKRVVRVALKRTISKLSGHYIMFLQNNIVFSYGSLISEECYNLNWMVVHAAIWAYLCFYSMDEMPVHFRANPSIKFSAVHLYSWVERSITSVLVKCLAQEHKALPRLKPGQQFRV